MRIVLILTPSGLLANSQSKLLLQFCRTHGASHPPLFISKLAHRKACIQ